MCTAVTCTPVDNAPPIAVDEVKAQLRRFALDRQHWPRHAAALELGELILCLMQQADRLGVDLVSAGEAQLQRAVTNARGGEAAQPRLALSLVKPGAEPSASASAPCALASGAPPGRR